MSSHNNGKCNNISKGSASAAHTINSDIPLFKVLVAKKEKEKKQIGILWNKNC